MEKLHEITVQDAYQMYEQNNVTIVDIRSRSVFDEGHIARSIHLDQSTLEEFLSSTDKATPVICYCYHGNSSKNASLFLQEKGFAKVYSLIGGFEAWRQFYPIEAA